VRIPRNLAMRGLRRLFADPSRLPQAWYDAAIDEFLRVLAQRPNRLATFSALRHVYLDEPFGGTGFWDRLPALEPPALFVWGRQDVLVPPGFARFVSAALPDARSVVLEECGHVPQFEHPEVTAQMTLEFLDALPAT
jgi:pimeloyl-ACP methyl ester carboxylesterase